MSRVVRERLLDIIDLLEEASKTIEEETDIVKRQAYMGLLTDTQNLAIALGTRIEKLKGVGTQTVQELEKYCECLYWMSERTVTQEQKVSKANLQEQMGEIQKAFDLDFPDKLEVVFLPYKASMWDSLESVWMAASEDENCETYVIPIPYYDKNEDGSMAKQHYEGKLFPKYVPITSYEEYDMELRKPDIVYIHNPYDFANRVTSVEPAYYSDVLKQNTKCLIYVPYWAASGNMAEGQALCPAYLNADYIVVQSEKYVRYYDKRIPREKLLPMGSPKFDKAIRLCKNPPQPAQDWKRKMEGKKVFFFNTSINGMLAGTDSFLKKMEYIFKTFEGRNDVCLLWRPHPLLESTFESMRKEFKPIYDNFKAYFLEHELGIYDTTPDIAETVALCDAYIGDAASSVTSLFGVTGKPLFILNNRIHSLPQENDWRGEMMPLLFGDGNDNWLVVPGNKLYYAPAHNYQYQFYCDLSEYTSGNYYLRAIEYDNKVYVCPQNAQDILVVGEGRVQKRILLENHIERGGAFAAAWRVGQYIVLVPSKYPAIVRYDTKTEEVEYIAEYHPILSSIVDGEWRTGSSCIWKDSLIIASASNDHVLMVKVDTMEVKEVTIGAKGWKGCLGIIPYGENVWLMPYEGAEVMSWNPVTGDVRQYSKMPEGFCCNNYPHEYRCMQRPFSWMAFCGDKAILPPWWGNMFVELDCKTGETKEWMPPICIPKQAKNDYYGRGGARAYFYRDMEEKRENIYHLVSLNDAKVYEINIADGSYQELSVDFNEKDRLEHDAGFGQCSKWQQYAIEESSTHTLTDFLEGKLPGAEFDRNAQLAAYKQIAANCDGTCGEKVHQFACKANR